MDMASSHSQSSLVLRDTRVQFSSNCCSEFIQDMGFRLPWMFVAKQGAEAINVPKGYLAVYVGEAQNKRFVVSVSY